MPAEKEVERSVLNVRSGRSSGRSPRRCRSTPIPAARRPTSSTRSCAPAGVEVCDGGRQRGRRRRHARTARRAASNGAPGAGRPPQRQPALQLADGSAAARSRTVPTGHDAPAGTDPPPWPPPAPAPRNPTNPDPGSGEDGPGERPSRADHGRARPAGTEPPARPAGRRRRHEPGNRRGRRRRGREPGAVRSAAGAGRAQVAGRRPGVQYSGGLPVRGLLDLRDQGYGFVRADEYLPNSRMSTCPSARRAASHCDVATSSRAPADRRRRTEVPVVIRIDSVCGLAPEEAREPGPLRGPHPAVPRREAASGDARDPPQSTTRIIDLLSPIGKGQRGRPGLAPEGREDDDPEADRPLDRGEQPGGAPASPLPGRRAARRGHRHATLGQGRVVASTFDRPSRRAHRHCRAHHRPGQAPGGSWTRCRDRARRHHPLGPWPYNLAQPASGRIMSGLVAQRRCRYPPGKWFFGAALKHRRGWFAHHPGHGPGGDGVDSTSSFS